MIFGVANAVSLVTLVVTFWSVIYHTLAILQPTKTVRALATTATTALPSVVVKRKVPYSPAFRYITFDRAPVIVNRFPSLAKCESTPFLLSSEDHDNIRFLDFMGLWISVFFVVYALSPLVGPILRGLFSWCGSVKGNSDNTMDICDVEKPSDLRSVIGWSFTLLPAAPFAALCIHLATTATTLPIPKFQSIANTILPIFELAVPRVNEYLFVLGDAGFHVVSRLLACVYIHDLVLCIWSWKSPLLAGAIGIHLAYSHLELYPSDFLFFDEATNLAPEADDDARCALAVTSTMLSTGVFNGSSGQDYFATIIDQFIASVAIDRNSTRGHSASTTEKAVHRLINWLGDFNAAFKVHLNDLEHAAAQKSIKVAHLEAELATLRTALAAKDVRTAQNPSSTSTSGEASAASDLVIDSGEARGDDVVAAGTISDPPPYSENKEQSGQLSLGSRSDDGDVVTQQAVELRELRKQNAKLRHIHAEDRRDLAKTQKQLRRARRALNAKDKELTAYFVANCSLKSDNGTQTVLMAIRNREIVVLERQLEAQRRRNQEIQSNQFEIVSEDVRQKFRKRGQEILDLRSRNRKLETRIHSLEEELQRQADDSQKLLNDAISGKNKEIQSINDGWAEQEGRLKGTITGLQNSLKNAAALRTHQAAMERKRDEIRNYKRWIQQLEGTNKDLQSHIDYLEKALSEKIREIERSEVTTKRAMEIAREEVLDAYQAAMSQTRTEINHLKDEVARLTQIEEDAKGELSRFNFLVHQLQNKLQAKEEEVTRFRELANQAEKLQRELEEGKNQQKNDHEKIQEQRQTIDRQDVELDATTAKNDELRDKIHNLQKKLDNAHQLFNDLNAESRPAHALDIRPRITRPRRSDPTR